MEESGLPIYKASAAVVILVLAVILLAFFYGQTSAQIITQEINYSDLTMTKTITLGSERVEEFVFDSSNHVVVFVIIPKGIAQSASEVKIDGEFSQKLIEDDPIFLLIPKDYSPGSKELKITAPVGNINLTTLVFAIPLVEYSDLSDEDKMIVEEMVIEVSNRGEANFGIEESKKIMQAFAAELESLGLREAKGKKKVYFSAASFEGLGSSIASAMSNALTTVQEDNSQASTQSSAPPGQTDDTSTQKLPAVGLVNALTQALSTDIIPDNRTFAELSVGTAFVTVKFSPDTADEHSIPKEVVLEYNRENEIIIWNAIIEKEEEISVREGDKLLFDAPSNFSFDYNRLEDEEITENIPRYIVTVSVDVSGYDSLIETANVAISHNIFGSQKEEIKFTLVRNNCNRIVNNFYKPLNVTQANVRKEEALYSVAVCTERDGRELLETYLKNGANYLVAIGDKDIRSTIMDGSLNYDPKSYEILSQERLSEIDSAFVEYFEANNKQKEFVRGYVSLIDTVIRDMKEIDSIAEAINTKEWVKRSLAMLELSKYETHLWLDPTSEEHLTLLAELEVDYLKEIYPELDNNAELVSDTKRAIRDKYLGKYGTWGNTVLLDFDNGLASEIFIVETELLELEKSFAMLLLSRSSGSCPTSLNIYKTGERFGGIYDPESTIVYNTPQYVDFRQIVRYFAVRGTSLGSKTSDYVEDYLTERDRVPSEIKNLIKKYQDASRCKIDVKSFEYPEEGTFNQIVDLFGWHRAEDFNERREGMRNRIETKVKQLIGMRLMYNLLYNYEKLDEEFNEQVTFNTTFEDLTVQDQNLSFLQVFEMLHEKEIVALWIGDDVSTNDLRVDRLQSALKEIYAGPLSGRVEIVKHMKFKDFVAGITAAEKLESEVLLIESIIDNEYLLTTMALEKVEDQAKINNILYYLIRTGFKGIYDPSGEIAASGDRVLGLMKIKRGLLEGRTLMGMYEETKEEYETEGVNYDYAYAPTEDVVTYTSNVDRDFTSGNTNVPIINESVVVNQDEITTWDESYSNVSSEAKEIKSAFDHPVLAAEIEKQIKIRENFLLKEEQLSTIADEGEKRELLLPKAQEAAIMLTVAEYYYEKGLYDAAYNNYHFIKYNFKGTDAAESAEKRMGQMGENWRMFFGKMYWETFASIGKEFVTLRSVATYLAVYGFIKFIAAPQIVAAKQADAARKAAASYLKGAEVVNPKNAQLLLNAKKTGAFGRAWSKVKNSKVWKVLNKDLLVSETWYNNYLQNVGRAAYMNELKYSADLYKTVNSVVPTSARSVADAKTAATKMYQLGLIDDATNAKILGKLDKFDEVFLNTYGAEFVVVSEAAALTDGAQITVLEAFNQRQLVPVGSAALAKTEVQGIVVFAGGSAAQEVRMFAVIEPALRIINNSAVDSMKATQMESRAASLSDDIAQWKGKDYTMVSAWEQELADLTYQKDIFNKAVEYDGVSELKIACSLCGFTIQGDQTFLGAQVSKTRHELYDQVKMIKLPKNSFTISGVTVQGQPVSTIKVKQIMDLAVTKPIATVAEISDGFVQLVILTKSPIQISAPGITLIEEGYGGERIVSGTSKAVSVSECAGGCSVGARTKTVYQSAKGTNVAEPTARGLSVADFKRVTSIKVSTKANPISISIDEQLAFGSKHTKIGKIALEESGGVVDLTWQGNDSVFVRAPTSEEIANYAKYEGIKADVKTGLLDAGDLTKYVSNKVYEGEALLKFEGGRIEIITTRADIDWRINGASLVSNPVDTTTQQGVASVAETTGDIGSSLALSTKHIVHGGKLTIGRPNSWGQVDYFVDSAIAPRINLSYDYAQGKFYTYSGSRAMPDRERALITRADGSEIFIENMPVDEFGDALVARGDKVYFSEGSTLEVAGKRFALETTSMGEPIVVELADGSSKVFEKDRIILGKLASTGEADVLVQGENNPVINIKKYGDGFQVKSGSRSGRNTAVIKSSGATTTIQNGTSQRMGMASGDIVSLSGRNFRITSVSGGIEVSEIYTGGSAHTFTCNSPCKWKSTNSAIKVVNEPTTTIEITGEFEKGLVDETRLVLYMQEGAAQTVTSELVVFNGENFIEIVDATGLSAQELAIIEDAMWNNKVFMVIQSNARGMQTISVYAPNIDEFDLMLTDPVPEEVTLTSLRDGVKAAGADVIGLHGTLSQNVPSILSNGLQPSDRGIYYHAINFKSIENFRLNPERASSFYGNVIPDNELVMLKSAVKDNLQWSMIKSWDDPPAIIVFRTEGGGLVNDVSGTAQYSMKKQIMQTISKDKIIGHVSVSKEVYDSAGSIEKLTDIYYEKVLDMLTGTGAVTIGAPTPEAVKTLQNTNYFGQFSNNKYGALAASKFVSNEMESLASGLFAKALETARANYPQYSDLFNKASFTISGSVAREEAVASTDIGYAIIFTENGVPLDKVANPDVLDAKFALDAAFKKEATKVGIVVDNALGETIEMMVIDAVTEPERYTILMDAKVIGGSQGGQEYLESLKGGVYGNNEIADGIINGPLAERMEVDNYFQFVIKEQKRELDYLLFTMRMKHDVQASVPADVVAELQSKGAITVDQGGRILGQMNKMIEFRHHVNNIKIGYNLEGEGLGDTMVQMIDLKYGEDAFDSGFIQGLENDLSKELGVTINELKQIYTAEVLENRALINEILGQQTSNVLAVPESLQQTAIISKDMRGLAINAFDSAKVAAKLERPDLAADIDKASLFVGGSVVRGEAVAATDIDYGILFVDNGVLLDNTTNPSTDVAKLLRDKFNSEAVAHGLKADASVGVAFGVSGTWQAHNLLLDTDFIAGNLAGEEYLQNAWAAIDKAPAQEFLGKSLELQMAVDDYALWSAKGTKRELDYALFKLKSENGISATGTVDAVNQLVQKGALTVRQAEGFMQQQDRILSVRLALDRIKGMASESELSSLQSSLGKSKYDEGNILGFEEQIASELGLTQGEFKTFYVDLVKDNRAWIREILEVQ